MSLGIGINLNPVYYKPNTSFVVAEAPPPSNTTKPDSAKKDTFIPVKDIEKATSAFNGGTLTHQAKDDTYVFSVTRKMHPGFVIETGNADISGKTKFKFEIKGTTIKHDEYLRLIVQVYRDTDNEAVPSYSLDPVPGFDKDNFTTMTVPLDNKIKKVKKIVVLLITDKGSCELTFQNLRFE